MDYYIYKNDQNLGPLSEGEVISGLKSGQFSPKDLGCRVGEDRWQDLEYFFPNTAHSWMDNPNESRSGSFNSQTQSPPRPSYVNSQQPGFQSHLQPSMQPVQVQHVIHHHTEASESALPMFAMVSGIVIACLMVIGLIPCLGWINWVVIGLGSLVKIVCWVAVFTEKSSKGRNKALIGLILVALALFVGGIRLILGGGCV
jgi:hypothetical protein